MADVVTDTETVEKWPVFPYPGLRPFRQTEDEDEFFIFHGRDGNIDDVVQRLNESQFVSVVGPSGCGKSSLVKVGVIPALMSGVLTRFGYDFEAIQMRPGQDPIRELAGALLRLNPPPGEGEGLTLDEMLGLLRTERGALWMTLEHLKPALAKRAKSVRRPRCVLLLIDQFEEIFSGLQDPASVDQFVRLLVQFFSKQHPQLCTIVTMRTDFIGHCANFPGLAEILNKTQYITPVLRGQNLHDSIVRPAEAYGGHVEQALVDAIRSDMGDGSNYDADHLPLMQHALLWLWQRAWPLSGADQPPSPRFEQPGMHGRVLLTYSDYDANGRLFGILENHADAIYQQVAAGGAWPCFDRRDHVPSPERAGLRPPLQAGTREGQRDMRACGVRDRRTRRGGGTVRGERRVVSRTARRPCRSAARSEP
jgi:energy-coupling factor transporter ATP-binding protein EcfA2